MRKVNNGTAHWCSLVIVLLLASVFVISRSGAQPVAVFAPSGSVIYRGNSGVALACAVRYNADIPALLHFAGDGGIPVTFFVTPEWAEENAELIGRMKSDGHDCGLLGKAKKEDELEREIERAKNAGIYSEFYMPSNDADAKKLARFARKHGYKVVLCSFEVKQATTDPADIVELVKAKWYEGAIIRFQPTKTMLAAFSDAAMALRVDGAKLTTLSAMLSPQGE